MRRFLETFSRRRTLSLAIALVSAVTVATALAAAPVSALDHASAATTKKFEGPKANQGTATCLKQGEQFVLTFSDDFVIPDTPAPHWQVVDSKGNVFLLQRLKIKDDKVNKTITVPCYVKDIAKVQIWCAWAETLLGEAAFPTVRS
jgi:hypothetical protein